MQPRLTLSVLSGCLWGYPDYRHGPSYPVLEASVDAVHILQILYQPSYLPSPLWSFLLVSIWWQFFWAPLSHPLQWLENKRHLTVAELHTLGQRECTLIYGGRSLQRAEIAYFASTHVSFRAHEGAWCAIRNHWKVSMSQWIEPQLLLSFLRAFWGALESRLELSSHMTELPASHLTTGTL